MNATDQVTRTIDFNHIVFGRRSIKIYDPTVKISHEEMSEMLGKATRAPSSINLQPWRFLVIESKKAKATLLDLAQSNSHQVVTSAAVIAIFGDLEHDTYAEDIFNTEVELGYMPDDVKKQMLSFTKDIYSYRAGYLPQRRGPD